MAKKIVQPKVKKSDGTYDELIIQNSVNSENATIATYASSDISKGTIEERLNRLGFKQGSITLNSGFTAVNNVVTRQGNYCILNLRFQLTITQIQNLIFNGTTITIGNLSNEFKPSSTISNYVYVSTLIWQGTIVNQSISINNVNVCVAFNVSQNGLVELIPMGKINSNIPTNNISTPYVSVQVGYESNPIS